MVYSTWKVQENPCLWVIDNEVVFERKRGSEHAWLLILDQV